MKMKMLIFMSAGVLASAALNGLPRDGRRGGREERPMPSSSHRMVRLDDEGGPADLPGAAAAETPLSRFRVALDLAYMDGLMGKPKHPEAPILEELGVVLADAAQREALRAEIDDLLNDAARVGYVTIAQLLLETGANPHFTSVRGETPLISAVKARSLPLVRLLVREYEVDPHVVGERIFGGHSALSVARELGDAEIIAELEHAGAKR